MLDSFLKRDGINLLKECLTQRDYDLITNIYMAFGNLVLSKNKDIASKAVE